MIKLTKEGILKVKIRQKRGLLHQTISQVVNVNEKLLKEIKTDTPMSM